MKIRLGFKTPDVADYEHLLEVLDKHFGDYVDFLR